MEENKSIQSKRSNNNKTLITGLTNKTGKKYKANFKLEVNDKYVNLSLVSFVN